MKCPDGPRTLHRRIGDVFPLYLTYARSSVAASIKGLEHIQAQAKISHEEKLSTALTSIDRINQSMQTQFRAAYTVYQTSPCTELSYFRESVSRIVKDEQRLRSVETIINNLNTIIKNYPKGPATNDKLAEIIHECTGRIISTLLPDSEWSLIEKMKSVSKNTAEWATNG